MANHTFPQTGDFSDGENFAHLFGQQSILDYVETGLDFTVDYAVPEVTISAGKAYISVDSKVAPNSGEDRTLLGYVVELDQQTQLLTDKDINHVYVEANAGSDDDPQIEINTTGVAPNEGSFKIGEIDTSANEYSQESRVHPSGRLVQNETATPDGEGKMWYKPSNGLVYFDNGVEFDALPAIGYQEGDLTGEEIIVDTNDPPRTELVNGDVKLIDRQTVALFESGTFTPDNDNWSWGNPNNLNVQTAVSITGTYSLEINANQQLVEKVLSRNKTIQQDVDFNFKVGNDTGNISTEMEIEVGDGSSYAYGLRWNDGLGNVEFYDIGGGTSTEIFPSWNEGQVYNIEFDTDFTGNTVDVYIDGTLEGTFSYTTSISGIKDLKFVNNTSGTAVERFIYLDDVYEGARESGEVVIGLTEPDDRIQNWDIIDYNATYDNESVVIDLETQNDAILLQDVANREDISSISETVNFQLRVKLSRTDINNNPTFNSWYRRFVKRPGDSALSETQKQELRNDIAAETVVVSSIFMNVGNR